MGTNYFLVTKSEKYKGKLGQKCFVSDEPYFCYKLHIMKNSFGWLPLFEFHPNIIESVQDIKRLYSKGDFEICDEYERIFSWDEFSKIYLEKYSSDKKQLLISHINKDDHIKLDIQYMSDKHGYEFLEREFR